MKTRNFRSILFFIFISILFHVFIFLFFKSVMNEDSFKSVTKIKYINTGKHLLTKKRTDKTEEEKIKETLLKGQIVEIAKPENETVPEKAKYLAEYDSFTQKETAVKKRLDTEILSDKVKTSGIKPETVNRQNNTEKNKTSAFSDNTNSTDDKTQEEKIRQGKLPGLNGKDGKMPKGSPEMKVGRIEGEDEKDQKSKIEVSGRIPAQYLPDINGSDYLFASPSNDYIKEDESDSVALNAKKFAYAKYFNDIKTAVSHYWKPAHILYANDPFGTIYDRKEKYTKLKVTINKLGFIKDIIVAETSGIDALDREAINAFKRAAPFGDTPKILLDDEEKLSFDFGFYLYEKKE